jgi:hypothetical protein
MSQDVRMATTSSQPALGHKEEQYYLSCKILLNQNVVCTIDKTKKEELAISKV